MCNNCLIVTVIVQLTFSVDLFYFDEVTEILGRIGKYTFLVSLLLSGLAVADVKRDAVYLFSFCQLTTIS